MRARSGATSRCRPPSPRADYILYREKFPLPAGGEYTEKWQSIIDERERTDAYQVAMRNGHALVQAREDGVARAERNLAQLKARQEPEKYILLVQEQVETQKELLEDAHQALADLMEKPVTKAEAERVSDMLTRSVADAGRGALSAGQAAEALGPGNAATRDTGSRSNKGLPSVGAERDHRIMLALQAYSGPFTRKGKPKLRTLREATGIDVTRAERNRLWDQV